ncbi:MAG: hypothetical protein IJ382_03225 [Flavobacteriales bacterium]|nr:hypothetical protein [Flavobacteriales bacterium]
MKLYFQAGKKRLAIDTVHQTYNTDYYYLGAFHNYIKTDRAGLDTIMQELDFNCYQYNPDFFSNNNTEPEEIPQF